MRESWKGVLVGGETPEFKITEGIRLKERGRKPVLWVWFRGYRYGKRV
jgi:hypothetical protein